MPQETTPALSRQANAARHITVCGGLYWACGYFAHFFANVLAGAEDWQTLFSGSTALYCIAIVACMALTTACSRKFTGRHGQCLLAWVAIAGVALDAVVRLPFMSLPPAGAAIVLVASGIGYGCGFSFWGLNFASLDRHDAERTTTNALAIALALYLARMLVVKDESTAAVLGDALMILGFVPFLLNRYEITLVSRPQASPNKKLLAPFYASRAFYGFCVGLSTFLYNQSQADDDYRATVPALIALIGVLLLITVSFRSDKKNPSLLRVTPLASCFAVFCVYLGSQNIGEDLCSYAMIVSWTCWMALYSTQISAIKQDSGLDDAFLALSEKVVYVLLAMCIPPILSLTPLAGLLAADEQLRISVALAVILLVLLVCSYQLNQVIDRKETERIVDAAFELTDKHNEPVYDRICEQFGLTAREADVLRLLAKGLSRTAIREELSISEGTERTHIRHIYQKLGIHSHDELMALLEKESRAHVAQ